MSLIENQKLFLLKQELNIEMICYKKDNKHLMKL